MNKIFLKLNGTSIVPTGSGSTVVITAKHFLGKEGGKTYCSPAKLVDYAKSLREPEIEQLDQAIVCMNAGLRTIGTVTTRRDKGGRMYSYLNFVKINATVGLKIILEAGMKDLIADYQDGKIVIGFTLEELVEEAMNP
jgi:hypothetical protein